MPLTLHDYQTFGVDHLERNPRAGLFMDMGLGKTATTLSALSPDHFPVLVVAPKRVADEVWPQETKKWRRGLKVVVASGTAAQRNAALIRRADITVISRDNLRDVTRRWPKNDHPYRTVILDELSSFKTRASVRWRAAKKIIWGKGSPVVYVWGLTGTPSPNGLLDLWAQVALLDGGERLGKTLTEYRGRYFTEGRRLPTGVVTSWDLRPGADEKIHALIDDICLSMESDGRISLPPVTFNTVSVPLTPLAREHYRAMKAKMVLDLRPRGGAKHTAGTAAVLSNRLAQLSAGFMYPDEDDLLAAEYDIIHREKIKALQEIIDGTGSPVLVFYQFRAELEMLRAAFPEASVINDRGVVPQWNLGRVPILFAHPASAGHGLNLQHGGHTVVWTSLTWSLEEWEQANARLARQGQQHPVVIHSLVSPNTVDEAKVARLVDKASVQDALMAHLESPL